MEKENFLHQLESAVINNEKKIFAKIIYDLPADVIISFTNKEFSRIIYISHQFSSHKVDRLCNFLENKGSFFLKNGLKGVDELNNFLLSKFYYSVCISLYETNKVNVILALMNNGSVCCKLADMGVDSTVNLETAVSLCVDARKFIPKTSSDYASVLMNEDNARQRLAEMGVDSTVNLETAINLYVDAKEIFPKTSPDYARTLVNEGTARQRLAEMGVDSTVNLETAVSLCVDARKFIPKTSSDYASVLMNEGTARQSLAEMGVDSTVNFETAINLYVDAKEIFPKTSSDYARVLMNEGNARQSLADRGVDSTVNLETAINLYVDAKEIFPKTSASYARALMNEGNIRQSLAEMGVDSTVNLETAINLYVDAKEIFPKTSASYASALVNEGAARQRLAEMGVDSTVNLETAINLYVDAKEIFPKTSPDYARTLVNEGTARQSLAEMDVDRKENNNRSKKLYLESIQILEKLGDGWSYSIALLKFYSLLKDNFYKTGDTKYLEEWKSNLGYIEEKIKDRDIRYKELLLARICEIRASLLEFDGKISDASFEYYEAYKLSKINFYKFMKEFCQARTDNKSFCKLVSDWEKEEKEGIFLDNYDYIVFECHLENALKSTINEEAELKLAVEKLKEIRDRTQIKIIKDRVSAYIHLLQALVDCFSKDSYKEAEENVIEGCRIFREYGDKQGQQVCNIFHNAIKNKRDPNAWQVIVRSSEFSSKFYSLLREYSERKRADLEFNRFGQIFEAVKQVDEGVKHVTEVSIRTENKLDKVQNTLEQIHFGFVEIKDQIEEGFNGTAQELSEIKGKVNNIEHDLNSLVQISDKVDRKEGECIRVFASQMLELMKKGDCEALKRFIEKIVENEASLEEIIKKGNNHIKEKEDAKSKLADFKKILRSLSENVVANLTANGIVKLKDVAVALTAEEIVKLLVPVLSMAVFGVPIPSKIVEILLAARKNL